MLATLILSTAKFSSTKAEKARIEKEVLRTSVEAAWESTRAFFEKRDPSQLDKAATCVLRDRFGSFESGAFRTIYGNDETVFDSPGFDIPSISLTRFPFTGYHTDADTLANVDRDALGINGGGVAYAVGVYAQDLDGRNGMPAREDRTRHVVVAEP